MLVDKKMWDPSLLLKYNMPKRKLQSYVIRLFDFF